MTESAPRKFSLTEQFQQRFNLLKDPFAQEQDSFFNGAQRQYILDTLRHLVNFGDMVLLLTGDKGSGKTIILKELITHTPEQLQVISLFPSTVNTSRALVSLLLKALDLHPVDAEPVYRSMQRIIDKTSSDYQKGVRCLLLADDAEALSADVFQLLIKTFKDLGVESGAVLLLSGKPELLRMVIRQGVQPEQCDWMHQLQIKSFTLDEMEDYLQFRFDTVGGDRLNLTLDQKEALSEMGKGNPGRINRVAPAVLLGAGQGLNRKHAHPLSPLHVKMAAGLTGLLFLSFVVVGVQYGFFSSEEGVQEASSSKKDTPIFVDLVRKAINDKINDSLAAQSKQVISATNLVAPTVPSVSLETTKIVKVENKNSSVPVLEKLKPKIVKQVKPKVAPTRHVKRPALALYEKSASWLRQQPKLGYVIQLSSNKNQNTAIEYIRGSGYAGKLFYVKTQRKNGARFVVLYGVYASQALARQASSKMPTKFKRQKPWVRSLSGLQSELGNR